MGIGEEGEHEEMVAVGVGAGGDVVLGAQVLSGLPGAMGAVASRGRDLTCPSCGGTAPGGRCRVCGAVYHAGRWSPGEEFVMPKAKEAKKESYILCPSCTEREGEEVYIYRGLLVQRDPLFGDPYTACPACGARLTKEEA